MTQAQLVYTALLNGSNYSHIGGCVKLGIGCYQRIISLLRLEYEIPVTGTRVPNKDGKGSHILYSLDADTRAELIEADALTPLQAKDYYLERLRNKTATNNTHAQ